MPVPIISIAQQAMPNVMGHREFAWHSFKTVSVNFMRNKGPSPCSLLCSTTGRQDSDFKNAAYASKSGVIDECLFSSPT
jgi:hypothetical protein